MSGDLWSRVANVLDPPPVDVFGLLGYTPEPTQKKFHDAVEFDVGFGGRAGTGKSAALLMDGIAAAVTYPGLHGVLFRRTYDELYESILSKVELLQQALEEHFGARYLASPHPQLRFANGSVIRFRTADSFGDATKRQGGEYQWVGIDERQQMDPAIPAYFITRIRSSNPSVPVLGIRSTFNPGDVGHADLKERYVERTRNGETTYEIMTHTDPPEPTGHRVRFVPGERSSHLDSNYWLQLASHPDPVIRRQLAEGDWDMGAGLMFSDVWRRDVHVVSPEKLPIPPGGGVLRARGIDYGLAAPFCCLWGAVLGDGMVVVYRELYETGLTPAQQARKIREVEDDRAEASLPLIGYLDPSCWTRNPIDLKRTNAGEYKAAGVNVVAAYNDRLDGVRMIFDHLRLRDDGLPRLMIYSTCTNLIREISSIPRSKKNPEDVDTHASDHSIDALRYLLMGLKGRTNPTARQHRATPYKTVLGDLRSAPL